MSTLWAEFSMVDLGSERCVSFHAIQALVFSDTLGNHSIPFLFVPEKQLPADAPDFSTLQKVKGLEKITAIAAGDHTSFALSEDGTLYSWGQGTNMLGQVSFHQHYLNHLPAFSVELALLL